MKIGAEKYMHFEKFFRVVLPLKISYNEDVVRYSL